MSVTGFIIGYTVGVASTMDPAAPLSIEAALVCDAIMVSIALGLYLYFKREWERV